MEKRRFGGRDHAAHRSASHRKDRRAILRVADSAGVAKASGKITSSTATSRPIYFHRMARERHAPALEPVQRHSKLGYCLFSRAAIEYDQVCCFADGNAIVGASQQL